MSFTVQEAVKKALKLRMSIAGPSGSGKTVGALRVAYGLCGDWKKIVLIDTNIDDSLAYAGDTLMGIGKFGHIPFPNPFTPKRFIEAINAAINYGAEVVIIDSASDEWAGPGGMLEMHDQVKGYNTAANWAKVNPEHLDFIKTMVEQKRAHIIATFRQKSKVAIDETEENGHKKSTVRRLGMENIARPGTEYDFLLAVEIDRETHKADIITKRGSMLPDMRPVELTTDLGKRLLAWASSGDEGKVETRDKPTETTTTGQPTNGKVEPEKVDPPASAFDALLAEVAAEKETTVEKLKKATQFSTMGFAPDISKDAVICWLDAYGEARRINNGKSYTPQEAGTYADEQMMKAIDLGAA
jgi:hypothetical protein